MNKVNNKVNDNQSQPAISITARLVALESQMAMAGYASDHPWRIEIGAVVAGPADPVNIDGIGELAIDCPYSTVHISNANLFEHACMRSRQLRGLLYFIQTTEDADELVELAQELGADLAEEILARNFHTVRASQLPMLLLAIQSEDGHDDMMWLAQQFADEIRSIVAALAAEQTAKVAA